MDLLTQAITQRPTRSPATPPRSSGQGHYNHRKSERSVTPPPPPPPPPAPTAADSRINARRNNILTQVQNLENEFTKKKDRYFHEQLRQLQEDLSRLHDGTHADFNLGVADLMDVRNESLYIAREEGLQKVRVAEEDYAREVAAANEEFDSTRATLKNDILAHLQNKRKRLESDKSLSDISLSSTAIVSAGGGTTQYHHHYHHHHQPNHPEAPPSPSLGHGHAGSRKLRHRLPVPTATMANYPPTTLTTKSALDEVLETLADTIKARHWKSTQQPQNEDRVRDRIEREREKLVRSMLMGVAAAEGDADLSEMKRKATLAAATSTTTNTSTVSASRKGHASQGAAGGGIAGGGGGGGGNMAGGTSFGGTAGGPLKLTKITHADFSH